mgnify:CR=1 FL=1
MPGSDDAGRNLDFDTADVYSLGESEKITGRLLKFFGVRRENVIVATKVNGAMSEDINAKGLSRKHILDSIDKSLERLQTETFDLYQCHAITTMQELDAVTMQGGALEATVAALQQQLEDPKLWSDAARSDEVQKDFATVGSVLGGGLLLVSYSLGLAIPFLLSGAAASYSLRLANRSGRWLRPRRQAGAECRLRRRAQARHTPRASRLDTDHRRRRLQSR